MHEAYLAVHADVSPEAVGKFDRAYEAKRKTGDDSEPDDHASQLALVRKIKAWLESNQTKSARHRRSVSAWPNALCNGGQSVATIS
jgi:hypothetical protein